jgi:hypothetical protein
MTVRLTRFLSPAEKEAMNDAAMARGYWRDDHRIFQPGWGWFEPWYWDPVKAAEHGVADWPAYRAKFEVRRGEGPFHGGGLLSDYYWQTWSKIRPPICVVLPNGQHWEIDRKSSNGLGWRVTGEWPNLTCTPSIAAEGYHGFLQRGSFTADCERPATPNGVYPYPDT